MMGRWKVFLAVAAIVVISATVSFAVSAAMPQAFLKAGGTRYAIASSETVEGTTAGTYTALPGMSKTISIPSGKTADLIILFCSEAYSTTVITLQAFVNSALATPSYTALKTGLSLESQCINFYKTGVGPGSKTISLQWSSSNGTVGDRTMIVIANIH